MVWLLLQPKEKRNKKADEIAETVFSVFLGREVDFGFFATINKFCLLDKNLLNKLFYLI